MSPATENVANSSHKRMHSDSTAIPQKRAKASISLPPLGKPIHTKFHHSSIKSPITGYTAGTHIAKNDRQDPKKVVMAPEDSLEDLWDQSWAYIRWDGREARPLLDRNSRSIGILAGIPQSDLYEFHCAEAQKLMIQLGEGESFSQDNRVHIRGSFPAFRCGVAFGPGQLKPHNLGLGPSEETMAQVLRDSPSIRLLAEMQDAMFQKWIPKLHSFYQTQLGKMLIKFPELKKNFEDSVWPTAAFNMARWVCSRRHRDSQNLLYGICAITSLGQFDHTKGGHLVLPDLQMVVEFPAGSIILILSALLEHANTPVPSSETRLSFTQYAAGAHFRYVEYGFHTVKELQKSNPTLYKELHTEVERNAGKGAGWMLYSTLDELRDTSLDELENMSL